MQTEKGLVIIYTGEGKGKTTASLGLILRAVGYKKRCLMLQFGKTWFTGELAGIKKLSPLVKIIQGGKGFLGILGSNVALKDHKRAASEAFDVLYKEACSGKWDVVVADEVVGAVASGVLPERKVVKLIADKPVGLDLVLTGRYASQRLIDLADLVTEMMEVKHPYRMGILAKKGVDF